MGHWIDDHLGWVIAAACAIGLALCVVAAAVDSKQREASCAHIYAQAESHEDSLQATIACERIRHPGAALVGRTIVPVEAR